MSVPINERSPEMLHVHKTQVILEGRELKINPFLIDCLRESSLTVYYMDG